MRRVPFLLFSSLLFFLSACREQGSRIQVEEPVRQPPRFSRSLTSPEDPQAPELSSALPYGFRTTAQVVFTATPPPWVSTSTLTFAFQEEPLLSPPPLFLCSLDSLPFEPCASPWTVNDLDDGTHQVSVSALDEKGFYLTPATYAFVVDTLPPVLTLTGPSGEITAPEVTFIFALSEPGTIFCALDGGGFFPCASPLNYRLPFGSHSFQAYGVDRVGNASPVLALNFKISAHLFFRYKPHARHSSYHLGVSWESSVPEKILGYECSMNGAPYTSCSPPVVWQHLAPGSYRFEVRALMESGGYSDPITATFDTVDCDSPGQMCVIAGVDTAEMVSQPTGEIPGTLYPIGEARGIALDGEGNLYVTDLHGNRILKRTPAGNLSILAGTGRCGAFPEGTPATQATLCWPAGMEWRGNTLYFGELLSRCIRRLDLTTLKVFTAAGQCYSSGYRDGPTHTSLFAYPYELRFHPYRNLLFVADQTNNRVRGVDLDAGEVFTVAGNGTFGFCGDGGPALNACFRYVHSVLPDPTGTRLWIGDSFNYRVREVDLVRGIITTVVGDGTSFYRDGEIGTRTGLGIPSGLEWDPWRSLLWIGSGTQGCLVTYDPVSTRVQQRFGICSGYFGDKGNFGDALGLSQVRIPDWSNALRFDPQGKGIFAGFSRQVRYFLPGLGSLAVIGSSNDQYEVREAAPGTLAPIGYPLALTGSLATKLYFTDYIRGKVYRLEGGWITPVTDVLSPAGIAWDRTRSKLYVASILDSVIYAMDETSGTKEILAGRYRVFGYGGDGGPATQAVFSGVGGVWLVPERDELYLTEGINNCIRVIALGANPPVIRTAAGRCGDPPGYRDGTTEEARFAGPWKITGNARALYIAELYTGTTDNFTVRKLSLVPPVSVTTVAGVPGIPGSCSMGGPALATPIHPSALSLHASGALLIGNYTRILRLDEETGTLEFLGPSPNADCGHPAFFGSGHPFSEGWSGKNVQGLLGESDGSFLFSIHGAAKIVRVARPW